VIKLFYLEMPVKLNKDQHGNSIFKLTRKLLLKKKLIIAKLLDLVLIGHVDQKKLKLIFMNQSNGLSITQKIMFI
jgi:hypothetical protein